MAFGDRFAAAFSDEFGPTYRQAGAQHLASRERQRDRDFRSAESEKDRAFSRELTRARYGNTGQEAAELQMVGGFLAELQNPESQFTRDPTARYGTLVELARTVTTPRAHALLRQFREFDAQIRFNEDKNAALAEYSQRLQLTPDGGQSYQAELQQLRLAGNADALGEAIGAIQRKQIEEIKLDRANQAKQGASELLQGLAQVPGIAPEVRGSIEMAFFAIQRGFLAPERVMQGIEQGLSLAFGDTGSPDMVAGFRQFPGAAGQPYAPGELGAYYGGGGPQPQGRTRPGMERVIGQMQYQKAPEPRPFSEMPEAGRRRLQRVMAQALREGGDRAALEVLLQSGVALEDLPDDFFTSIAEERGG